MPTRQDADPRQPTRIIGKSRGRCLARVVAAAAQPIKDPRSGSAAPSELPPRVFPLTRNPGAAGVFITSERFELQSVVLSVRMRSA
jgi:hypothetical protein